MTITLKTLADATPMEVFEHVKQHLLRQNVKAVDTSQGSYACYYREPGGLVCAAGCLIADDEYNAEMENHDWDSLVAYGTVPEAHAELINRLQFIHDFGRVAVWKEMLNEVEECVLAGQYDKPNTEER